MVHVIGHSYRLGDELALRAADGGDHAIRSRAVQLAAPGAPPAPLLTFDRVDRG